VWRFSEKRPPFHFSVKIIEYIRQKMIVVKHAVDLFWTFLAEDNIKAQKISKNISSGNQVTMQNFSVVSP